MAEIRVSEEARVDLEEIRAAGIGRFGERAAERHMQSIRQSLELLVDRPLLGQARPDFQRNIRSISRRPHRILYTVHDDIVLVIRVIHQARDVAAALLGGS